MSRLFIASSLACAIKRSLALGSVVIWAATVIAKAPRCLTTLHYVAASRLRDLEQALLVHDQRREAPSCRQLLTTLNPAK
jgi:hypothetical protein